MNMNELEPNGRALLSHLRVMQNMAQSYVTPGPYVAINGERVEGEEQAVERNKLFATDILYLLDGPEQRFAESQAGFDYVTEASLTLSNKFHGELVSKANFRKAINDFIEAANQLDKVKKTLFYGRDNNINPVDGQGDVSDMPTALAASNSQIEHGLTVADAENYIHGVIGLATEAGELVEALKHALNGEAIDRVNIKEEVGDAKWYMAILAKVGRFIWGEDERTNIAKLRARFPDNFTEFDAQQENRKLSVERQILEAGLPIAYRTTKMEGERNLDGDAIEAQKPIA